MELDAEPAQKPLAKIRQAKRFLRAGEEIVAAAKAAQEEFWSDLLDGSMDERCQEIIRGLRKEDPRGSYHFLPSLPGLGNLQ